MPLDDQRPISNNFNRSGEQDVQNRISPYDLNENERAEVWQAVNERNENIDAERLDYRENWNDRVENEVERLRGEQQPQPQLNMGNRQLPNQAQLGFIARGNVQANHINTIRGYEHAADNKVNQVLDNARKDGRGPQQDQNRGQNQNHDNDRDDDNDRDR